MSEPRDRNRASSTLIVIVYAVLALAATGRSSVQLATVWKSAQYELPTTHAPWHSPGPAQVVPDGQVTV